jgi:deoxycytidylate deaminase
MSDHHTSTTPPASAIRAAVSVGSQSPCMKSKRGAALWWPSFDNDDIVSAGYNRPLLGSCDGSVECRRDCGKVCLHAEQDALLGALYDVRTAEMLHVKVVDGEPVEGGPPSCVECSKLILRSRLAAMWLLQVGRGWVRYTVEEFHRATLKNLGLHGGAP